MALAKQYLPVLDAARSGSPAALEQLLRLCQPDIRRYAQRSCMISDVDDAVQETLLVLSRRLASVRTLAAFSGWLFKIVQRECRKLGRKPARERLFIGAEPSLGTVTRDNVFRDRRSKRWNSSPDGHSDMPPSMVMLEPVM